MAQKGDCYDKDGHLLYAVGTGNILLIPAADVVEVVRCADCKYDERCMFQDFVRDERVEPYDKTVFYCADGKRNAEDCEIAALNPEPPKEET